MRAARAMKPPNEIKLSGERSESAGALLGNGQPDLGRKSETRGVLDVQHATRLSRRGFARSVDEERPHSEDAALRDKTWNRARRAGLCGDLGLRKHARVMGAGNYAKGSVALM